MPEAGNPGALEGATGAGMPCFAKAAASLNIAPGGGRGNALAQRLAPFAALDPATLTAPGLVAARLWGAAH